MTDVTIRRLGTDEAAIFRTLRLEALETAPLSFGVQLADALTWDEAAWQKPLEKPVFCAFVDGVPAGLAGLFSHDLPAERHRMTLALVFVRPGFRGQRLADQLVNACCDYARDMGALQVELIVTDGNEAARQIYLRNGFVQYGLLPRGRCIGGTFVDDVQMLRRLD